MPGLIGVALAFCVLIAVGLVRRDYRTIGIGVIAVAGVVAITLALAGHLRPGLIMIGVAGPVVGVDLDERGHRPAAVLALAVGLVCLVVGVLPDFAG